MAIRNGNCEKFKCCFFNDFRQVFEEEEEEEDGMNECVQNEHGINQKMNLSHWIKLPCDERLKRNQFAIVCVVLFVSFHFFLF